MGCGAATTDKDAIKPLPQPHNEIVDKNQERENSKTEKSPVHESGKHSPKEKKALAPSPAGTSNLRGSSTGKKYDKIKNSDVNITTSNSRIKRSDSLQKSSKEKSLRESSPGKSNKYWKEKDTSKSSKKNMNP